MDMGIDQQMIIFGSAYALTRHLVLQLRHSSGGSHLSNTTCLSHAFFKSG